MTESVDVCQVSYSNGAPCGQPFARFVHGSSTLVGYYSPAGHDHDDNCTHREYICTRGHRTLVYLRRSCSKTECKWRGKTTCRCHDGDKVDRWPVAQCTS